MHRLFKSANEASSENKLAAIKLLQDLKNAFQAKPFPLQNTSINTVNLLLDVINGDKPLDNQALKNAALVDAPSKGNPIVTTLLEMGVKYSVADIEFIRIGNKAAAGLLESQLKSEHSLKQ